MQYLAGRPLYQPLFVVLGALQLGFGHLGVLNVL
ncbi:MAG: hypothetical protein ACI8TF_001547 [Paracoccaceae bacterium]|jgi:hypothetical protein